MQRSKKMQELVDSFSKQAFGRTMKDPVCLTCGSDKVGQHDFRDSLSIKEFEISHMCQECQDSLFET